MGLTITEKSHWKERISRRIDQAIERLIATEDSGFMQRVGESARKMALASLGLAEAESRMARIHHEEKALGQEKEELLRKMLAIVRKGAVPEHVSEYSARNELDSAIAARKSVHENELLAKLPTGMRILKLRREKEELLDTVWLATSGQQIKELWKCVSELLSEEPTTLQTSVLARTSEPGSNSVDDE